MQLPKVQADWLMHFLLEIHVPQRLNKHAKKKEEDHQGQGINKRVKEHEWSCKPKITLQSLMTTIH
jgi:hypothetical protein